MAADERGYGPSLTPAASYPTWIARQCWAPLRADCSATRRLA